MKLLRKVVVCPALLALTGCAAEDPGDSGTPPVAVQKQELAAVSETDALESSDVADAPAQAPASTWTSLTNAPPGFLDTCLVLTDATVMCHLYNTNQWHRLTPDQFGSYANGTWDT